MIAASAAQAVPVQLIGNGGFETGTFSPWATSTTGSGAFLVNGNGSPEGVLGYPTQTLAGGQNFVAVASQEDLSVMVLRQQFTKLASYTSLVLDFDWFARSFASFSGSNLAFNSGAQVMRVDITTSSASAFTTTTGLVQNLMLNQGVVDNNEESMGAPWQHFNIDLSSLAAGTYYLRFAVNYGIDLLHMGVDNVSLFAEQPAPPPPPGPAPVLAPAAWGLLGLGLISLRTLRRA